VEWIAGPEDEGRRLDRFVELRVLTLSRMRLRLEIDRGAARVNGAVRPAGWRLRAGDQVVLDAAPSRVTAMTPEPLPLRILYEDADLVVVEKAAGMVVHPAGRHRGGTLANALAHHFNVAGAAEPPVRPGIVHRLDRATSGLMVVAKAQAALSALTVRFQNREVEKEYVGLVHGAVAAGEGEWDAPIGADPEATPRWGIRPGGRPARSRYRVRERLPEHTLLELEPLTGRTNQLRLHAAHFGHPLVGDALFGRPADPGPGRLFLHAHLLRFEHPCGRRLEFRSHLPAELEEYLGRLRAGGG